MEKVLSYKNGSIICITPQTTQGITIQSGKDSDQALDVKMPSKTFTTPLGHWVVECVYQHIYLRENAKHPDPDVITLSFQQPEVDVKLDRGNGLEFFQEVSRIEVYPSEVNQIKIQMKDDKSEEGPSDIPQPAPVSPTGDQRAEIERLKRELERERATSRSLQGIVTSKMDELIGILDKNSSTLSADNLFKRQRLETLQQEVDRLQQEAVGTGRQIDEANRKVHAKTRELLSRKEELEALKVRLGDLEEQKEVAELDCEAAQAQLEEIKAHLQLDQETIDLLEDGYQLKHGSISKTLAEAAKELEKAEKKISFILKLREKFNNAVDDAILCGDGAIPASEEIGENTDGN